mgnify:CR=1 FL=1
MNCLQERTAEILLAASGESRKDALGNAFAKFKKEAYKQLDQALILQMEPMEVEILEENIVETTEKFLFIFMPKVKTQVQLKVRILTRLKFINS